MPPSGHNLKLGASFKRRQEWSDPMLMNASADRLRCCAHKQIQLQVANLFCWAGRAKHAPSCTRVFQRCAAWLQATICILEPFCWSVTIIYSHGKTLSTHTTARLPPVWFLIFFFAIVPSPWSGRARRNERRLSPNRSRTVWRGLISAVTCELDRGSNLRLTSPLWSPD